MITDRWTPLKPHPEQIRLINSPARFKTVPAGRRSGKTEIAKRLLVRAATRGTDYISPRFFAAAPTRDQAKRIFWDDLKLLTPKTIQAKPPSESELTIYFTSGSQLVVVGMDKPERIEGPPWDGGVLDEFGNMKEKAWKEHTRPALSDRQGWCMFIGVPEGRNHYYDLDKRAKVDNSGEWDSFHWISADILPPEEIAAAKRDLDELTYLQEYEASFISFEGRAYYVFDERTHTARIKYNPRAPLIVCLDFNVAPGVAAIIQEKTRYDIKAEPILGDTISGVIGEVWIPRNSNTPMVCNRIIKDYGDHQGDLYFYGDATGGASGSAKVAGSDWDLVKDIIGTHFGKDRVHYRIPNSNPGERERVNAVNSRLKSMDGIIRLMVDPRKAPNVVKDFEGVQLIAGGSGEIDKKKNPTLTHLCFAAGTLVELKNGIFPIEQIPIKGKIRTWNGEFVEYSNAGKIKENVEVIGVYINDGSVIYCTPEHLWLSQKGWICAKDLKGLWLMSWQLRLSAIPSKYSTEKNSIDMMARKDILDARVGKGNSISIGLFGFITGEKYLKAIKSIIKTGIKQITKLKILKCLQLKNISTKKNHKIRNGEAGQGKRVLRLQEKLQKHGIAAKKVIYGTLNIIKRCEILSIINTLKISAPIAKKNFIPLGNVCIAARTARQDTVIMPKQIMKQENVQYAERNFRPISIQRQNLVLGNVEDYLEVIDIWPSKKADVYCLTVPYHGCFVLKNGVIVSNCDGLGYYVHYEFPISKAGGGMVSIRGF